MEQFGTTIRVKLVARRLGEYTVYIFQDLDKFCYITVTKLPNWQGEPDIRIGDTGYLTYKFIIADKDTWVDKTTGEVCFYRYSGNHYLSFIPDSHVINNNIASPKDLLVR